MKPSDPKARLVAVTLDEASIGRGGRDVEHERAVAIFDLLERNRFQPVGREGGPWKLHLAMVDRKLVFEVRTESDEPVVAHLLALTPFRRIVKDYFLICDSYYAAIRTASPAQIEAIDMGRRGLHDEAAQVLQERLSEKISLDFDTARRLFTLVTALHWKG